MKKRILYIVFAFILSFCCLNFAGCGKNKNSYNIVVQSLHYNLGSVEGGNETYYEGDIVTIKAIPTVSSVTGTPNSEFFGWLLNNKLISKKAEYKFTVSKESAGNYLAIFTSPNSEYFSLSSVKLQTGITPFEAPTEDTFITNIDIFAGNVENMLNPIFSNVTVWGVKEIEINSSSIYQVGSEAPYAYDMQENIYLKIVITYVQDDVTFVSTTNTLINASYDVTKDAIGIEVVELNTAKDPTNNDWQISLQTTPTITLTFNRLISLDLPKDLIFEF